MKRLLSFVLFAPFALSIVVAAPLKQIVIDKPELWSSVPFEFLDSDQSDVAHAMEGDIRLGWERSPISLKELCSGVKLTRERSRDGRDSLEWRNHHKYPTVAFRGVDADWRNYGEFCLSCYSEKPTHEIITIGVLADNPATPYLDYWVKEFPVDWTGWKDLRFPLSQFERIGAPMGWNNVKEVCFFTKNKWRSPSPETAIFLNSMSLVPLVPLTAGRVAAESKAEKSDILRVEIEPDPNPARLNHKESELSTNLKAGEPLVQQLFFAGARSVYAYNPRYAPGRTSVSPAGSIYVYSGAKIQWEDSQGIWQQADISEALKAYAKMQKWEGIAGGINELAFDGEGDFYVLASANRTSIEGKELARSTILLHAKDLARPWTAYELPSPIANFERLDAHNLDALNHPPVITLKDYSYFPRADQAVYLMLPEKIDGGLLHLPARVKITDIGLIGPVHSGGANFVISHGDKVYIVYGVLAPYVPGTTEIEDRKATPEWLEALNIPLDHPARKMECPPMGKSLVSRKATDGVPAFVVEYDRKTKSLGKPVFVGYGGGIMDYHNWPGMTIDSKGNLHVVISGHSEPLAYTHTLAPGDITKWSEPIYIQSFSSRHILSAVSYPSLNCDKSDNLFVVARSDSSAYNHRLGLLTKPAGKEEWNEERPLVIATGFCYHVWHHRVDYDPVRSRYFLSFDELWGMSQLGRSEYLFCRFIWPDIEPALCANAGKEKADSNLGIPALGSIDMFTPGPADRTVMASDDGGKYWRLATSPDFAPPTRNQSGVLSHFKLRR